MTVQFILKNGKPEWAVLPYDEFLKLIDAVDMLENQVLHVEAEERMNATAQETVSHEQLLEDLGITETDLSDIEIDVDNDGNAGA